MRKTRVADIDGDSSGEDDLLLELVLVLGYPVHRIATTGVRPRECLHTFGMDVLDGLQSGHPSWLISAAPISE